jgi:hypothetical protein
MNGKLSPHPGWAFRISVIVLAAIMVGEITAFAGFKLFATDRLARHWRIDPGAILSELSLDTFQRYLDQFFDPVLGWSFDKDTTAIPYATFDELGARVDPADGPTGKFAAYGDSFTFGEDVGADETWPHYLSEQTQVHVANYGVAGYGPDQSLLRLKGHLEQGKVPDTVVLGVLSENIGRVVNVWRQSYAGGETLNFKPILWVEDGVTRWIPTPLALPGDTDSVRQAIIDAQPFDFWLGYNQLRPNRPHFPYLLSAFDTARFLSFRIVRWQDLWEAEKPVAIFRAIMGEFVMLSQEYDFRPILVMIPMGEDLRLRDAEKPSTYGTALAVLRQDFGDKLTILDTLDEPFEASQFNLKPFAGHASPYGNRAIASAIFSSLPSGPSD